MAVANLVLGLALGVVGVSFLVRRHSFARNEASRGGTVLGPTGWSVLGTILLLAGVLQVVRAFA